MSCEVGNKLGICEGEMDGFSDGFILGIKEGFKVGDKIGTSLRVEGYEEGTCDEEIGVMEGMLVGNNEFNKTELVGNTLGLLV